jgi:ribosome maturation factor RimP
MQEGTEKSPLLFDSYMDLVDKVRELAQSCLVDESLFLVEVIISSRSGSRVLVILDGDKGVTIEVCTKVSRALATMLDESDLIDENYTLEVTTPGLDHPLKLRRQYYKNVGRGFKVHTNSKGLMEGKLAEVNDHKITLQQEVKQGKKIEIKSIEIPFEEIDKAFVMVSFK